MTSQVHRKLCFITVGATANFDLLIRASVDLSFLQYLSTQGYTDLFLQHGKNGDKLLRELLPEVTFARDDPVVNDLSAVVNDIKISSFDFRKEGLQKEMLAARGGSLAFRDAGVVICHAGAGTILDGLRIGVPLIVVPNPSLLDNHQDELAEELARQGYVVHGRIDAPNGLQEAVAQSEVMKKQQSQQWPPVNSGESARRGRGLAGVMDEEMGFLLD